ncbi:hypothetical protein HPB50_016204 [Hyalomma asiaticum]|uniref:Uncharacterized protein n=1 Tax=Hyalomma asiaticum TaxID=266040 RepID=A0ACB7SNA1_HYAAI|nr:hypothetical protein HPB50_016204 [Hyalomma asiaticum]
MCEKLTEAFERVVSLSECSSVKDAPNFLTPQRRNPPHGRRCWSSARLVNMCEKLTEAFERVVSLSECSSVKDAPNFLTPQRRNPPHGRRCWSSARRRPSFLNDSSDSEDEITALSERKPHVPRVVTLCTVVKTPSTEDNDAWFLESLSDGVQLKECHPDTLRFRQHFNGCRQDLASALFSIFTREIFADKLPAGEISWNSRLTSTAGRCFYLPNYKYRVELSLKLLRSAEQTRDTLLHELCHAGVWCLHNANRGGHGELWKFCLPAGLRHPNFLGSIGKLVVK